jgi:hypothetical protein
MGQRPTAIGVLLCEKVIAEVGTNNLTIVSSFFSRAVAQFPSKPFPFVVFAMLTDGLGDVLLEVSINRLDNLEEVYRASVTAHFPDPLHVYRCKLRVLDCSFPVAGGYDVTLHIGGEPIARRKITIIPRRNVS